MRCLMKDVFNVVLCISSYIGATVVSGYLPFPVGFVVFVWRQTRTMTSHQCQKYCTIHERILLHISRHSSESH